MGGPTFAQRWSWSNRPEVRDKHWDDYTDPESGVAFFENYLRAALAHCVEGVAVYQWFATKRHVLVEVDRFAGLAREFELAPHEFGAEGAAAGRVHAQHDGLDLVVLEIAEPLAELSNSLLKTFQLFSRRGRRLCRRQ